MGVQVTSQLSDQFSVLFVVSFGLEGLVFDKEFAGFFARFFLYFTKLLLKLMALGV